MGGSGQDQECLLLDLYFRMYALHLTQVMYVLHDSEGLYLCLSIKLVQTRTHPELYKRKAVGLQ